MKKDIDENVPNPPKLPNNFVSGKFLDIKKIKNNPSLVKLINNLVESVELYQQGSDKILDPLAKLIDEGIDFRSILFLMITSGNDLLAKEFLEYLEDQEIYFPINKTYYSPPQCPNFFTEVASLGNASVSKSLFKYGINGLKHKLKKLNFTENEIKEKTVDFVEELFALTPTLGMIPSLEYVLFTISPFILMHEGFDGGENKEQHAFNDFAFSIADDIVPNKLSTWYNFPWCTIKVLVELGFKYGIDLTNLEFFYSLSGIKIFDMIKLAADDDEFLLKLVQRFICPYNKNNQEVKLTSLTEHSDHWSFLINLDAGHYDDRTSDILIKMDMKTIKHQHSAIIALDSSMKNASKIITKDNNIQVINHESDEKNFKKVTLEPLQLTSTFKAGNYLGIKRTGENGELLDLIYDLSGESYLYQQGTDKILEPLAKLIDKNIDFRSIFFLLVTAGNPLLAKELLEYLEDRKIYFPINKTYHSPPQCPNFFTEVAALGDTSITHALLNYGVSGFKHKLNKHNFRTKEIKERICEFVGDVLGVAPLHDKMTTLEYVILTISPFILLRESVKGCNDSIWDDFSSLAFSTTNEGVPLYLSTWYNFPWRTIKMLVELGFKYGIDLVNIEDCYSFYTGKILDIICDAADDKELMSRVVKKIINPHSNVGEQEIKLQSCGEDLEDYYFHIDIDGAHYENRPSNVLIKMSSEVIKDMCESIMALANNKRAR